jgi:tetratricopeptide (TPR) repeat protein
MTLDTSLKIEPHSLARKTLSPRVAADAEKRASEGDYEAALALFTEAKNMDPSLDIDPAQRAAEYSAPGLVHKGVRLSYRGEVKQAIAAFAKAQQLRPDLEIESASWNEICWNGSLWGYAAEVMFACDRAVELDEGAGSLDSRGLARALVGDRAGALEDFREFLDLARYREGLDNEIAQRTSWIAALERGENPLTKEVLAGLRSKL